MQASSPFNIQPAEQPAATEQLLKKTDVRKNLIIIVTTTTAAAQTN